MKIAIVADSHDHLIPLRAALERAAEAGCQAVIHCGDLIAPFVIAALKQFDGPVHVVFGNNDGDIYLQTTMAAGSNVTVHGTVAELEIDGRKFLVTHEPPVAQAFATTMRYDAVFHGHNHEASEGRVGETLLVGAGELMGFKERPSFAIYDTETNGVERVDVGDVWAGYG